MKKACETAAVMLLFFLICLAYKSQQRISYNGGLGWDGVYYNHLAEQIYRGSDPISGEQPFIKRPGTPFLIATYARLTGTGLLDSALAVNLAGTFLAAMFLFVFLGWYFDRFWLRGMLTFLFMVAWFVPLRMSFHDPMATDAWGAATFMGGLLFLPVLRKTYERKQIPSLTGYLLAFSLVVAVGCLFRESNLVLYLALFFVVNPLQGFENLLSSPFSFRELGKSFRAVGKRYRQPKAALLLLPVVFILLSRWMLSGHVVVEDRSYSYLKTLFKWFYTKSLPEYLLGLFNACGPLVVLLPFFTREIGSLLWKRQELLFLLAVAFLFGLVGGSDTERIFYMSAFPVLALWTGYAIRGMVASSRKGWLYVLCALQAVSYRLFWNLPDYPGNDWNIPVPFFGIPGIHFQYLFLYSHHGQYILNSLIFAEYVLLFLATWYVLSRKSGPGRREPDSGKIKLTR